MLMGNIGFESFKKYSVNTLDFVNYRLIAMVEMDH